VTKSVLCAFWSYLKLLEEDHGEGLSEVGGAEDGLDDDHSSVARVHQQVSDWLHKGPIAMISLDEETTSSLIGHTQLRIEMMLVCEFRHELSAANGLTNQERAQT